MFRPVLKVFPSQMRPRIKAESYFENTMSVFDKLVMGRNINRHLNDLHTSGSIGWVVVIGEGQTLFVVCMKLLEIIVDASLVRLSSFNLWDRNKFRCKLSFCFHDF